MDLEHLRKKQNENMQLFLISKINELEIEEEACVHRIEKGIYYRNKDFLLNRAGKCKVEREYYTYFLYLLREENKRVEEKIKLETSFRNWQLKF